MAHSTAVLTDDEATFLSLLLRMQPATAYQLLRVYEESPVSNFGTSKGKIYPLVRRLKARGLIEARAIVHNARDAEALRCTRDGRAAVRNWVKQVRPSHLLPEDPLRTMVQSFDLLSVDDQIKWIETVETGLRTKLDELGTYGASVTVPYKDQVHDNAVSSLLSRLDWIGRLKGSITKAEQKKQN